MSGGDDNGVYICLKNPPRRRIPQINPLIKECHALINDIEQIDVTTNKCDVVRRATRLGAQLDALITGLRSITISNTNADTYDLVQKLLKGRI